MRAPKYKRHLHPSDEYSSAPDTLARAKYFGAIFKCSRIAAHYAEITNNRISTFLHRNPWRSLCMRKCDMKTKHTSCWRAPLHYANASWYMQQNEYFHRIIMNHTFRTHPAISTAIPVQFATAKTQLGKLVAHMEKLVIMGACDWVLPLVLTLFTLTQWIDDARRISNVRKSHPIWHAASNSRQQS